MILKKLNASALAGYTYVLAQDKKPAPGLSCGLQGDPHAEEVRQGAGPGHTHDARPALAFPRLSDCPQGGGSKGRQGLGRHHRLREREDGSPGPYLLAENRHSAVELSLCTA